MEFLESQRTLYPDLQDKYVKFLEQHQSRLWHQLADSLLDLFTTPGASRGDNFIQLYERFLSTFETRINQLKLVLLLKYIANQYIVSSPFVVAEVDQAITFLEGFLDKKKRLGDEAFSVLLSQIAELILKRAAARSDLDARNKDLDAAKATLESSLQTADGLAGADALVYSAYYRAAAQYHKIRGPASAFYSNALQYLAYTPVESVPLEERRVFAVDISLAALVGEGVFNFGEIIEHSILSSLEGTPDAWLGDLLKVFHTGDVDRFNLVVSANLAAYQAQPALVAFDGAIKEKVALVCTMELASLRPPGDRSLTFADIGAAARLPLEQVEWLLMRAMSLGLIRGTIDQVDGIVHVSYIKPHVLSPSQILGLKEKLQVWGEKTKSATFFVEDATRELFA